MRRAGGSGSRPGDVIRNPPPAGTFGRPTAALSFACPAWSGRCSTTGHADCRPLAASASVSVAHDINSGARDFGRLFDSPQWPCARGLSDRCSEKPSPPVSQPPACRAQRITRRLRRRLCSLRQADLVPPGIAGHKELRAPAARCCLRAPGSPAHGTRDPPAPHRWTCCTQQDLWGGGARSGCKPDKRGASLCLRDKDFRCPALVGRPYIPGVDPYVGARRIGHVRYPIS